ncbi:MAG: carbon-nitrogen hydrolase family protein [Nesterenkonia sp.]
MITVAVGQLRPRIAQPHLALSAVERAAQSARSEGADLLIVPEAFLTGYAIGAAATARLAEPVDGELAAAVANIARRHSIAVVFGFAERGADGRVFNAASFISENGKHLAVHRKLHLFQSVDAEQFAAGDDRPPVVEWNGWNVGLAICYDIEFPETVRMLAEDGADLICTPTANMVGFEQVSRLIIPTRAYESQLYIAYANYCGADDAFSYAGTSVIASPTGELCAVAGPDAEEIITADLDRTTLEQARRNLTYLADRRLDLYGRGW